MKFFVLKKILFIILISVSVISMAQTIPNGSFEDVDSIGNLLNWKISKGNVTRITSKIINGIPFTATDNNYFLSLQNDTISLQIKTAEVSNPFPITSKYFTFSYDYFYSPTFSNQHAGIEILFTKWKNNSRDTIAFFTDTIKPILDSNNYLKVKWNLKNIDILPGYLDSITVPDTAIITLKNDMVSPFANRTLLFLDKLKFSTWKLGVDETSKINSFSLFPNPANDFLNIDFVLYENEKVDFRISDLMGRIVKEFHEQNFNSGKNEFQINVSDISSGIYFVKKRIGQTTTQKKFLVIR